MKNISKTKSLTLVELLLVIVILSILGSGYLVYSKSNVENTKQVITNINILNVKKQEQIDKILGKPEVKEEPKKYSVVNKFSSRLEKPFPSLYYFTISLQNNDIAHCNYEITTTNGFKGYLSKGKNSSIIYINANEPIDKKINLEQEKIISVKKLTSSNGYDPKFNYCTIDENEIGVEF